MRAKIFLMAILLVSLGHACVSLPTVYMGDSSFPYIGSRDITQAEFDNYAGNYAAEQSDAYAALSSAEKRAIYEFIMHGYSTKKMSEAQYAEFLDNASRVTSDSSTCAIYNAVAYADGWAGWSKDDYSNKTPACVQQPRPMCGGGFFLLFLNDLPTASHDTDGTQQTLFGGNNLLILSVISLVIIVLVVVGIMRRRR